MFSALRDQHRELVTAEARRRVRLAHQAGEAARRRHEQLVADAVAHGVVDDLEVVEVDEQHARDQRRPPGGGELLGDPVLEQHPVGQPGQRVVEGPVLQLLLELVLLGHVPQGEDEAGDGRLGAQVTAPGLDVDARCRPAGGSAVPRRAGRIARARAAA